MFLKKDEEKITDKAFNSSLISSVVSILLCLIVLCSMTYAWFSTDSSSAGNVLGASCFALKADITDPDGNVVETVELIDGRIMAKLENAGIYNVTLCVTDDTTATKGYCAVTLNSTHIWHTEPISRDSAIGAESFSFSIETVASDTTAIFDARWGISASIDLVAGELIFVPAESQD